MNREYYSNHTDHKLDSVNSDMTDRDKDNSVTIKEEYISDESTKGAVFDNKMAAVELSIKHEDITFECSICFMQFVNVDSYREHVQHHGEFARDSVRSQCEHPTMRTNTQAALTHSSGGDSSLSTGHSQHNQSPSEGNIQVVDAPVPMKFKMDIVKDEFSPEEVDAMELCKQSMIVGNDILPDNAFGTRKHNVKTALNKCIQKKRKDRTSTSKQNGSLKIARETISSSNWNSQNKDTDSKHLNVPTTSSSVVITTNTVEPATETVNELYVSKPVQSETECADSDINIQCDDSTVISLHIDKPFACGYCDYRCGRRGTLAKHVRVHTGEKPFACNYCEYRGREPSSLTRHMLIHTGEKTFACKLCDYKSNRSPDLVLHMRSHTGEMPFACTLCNYRCKASSRFALHMRIHTGEKPFACDKCSYRCRESSSLTRHMLTHTGEKPFACDMCDHRFSIKSSLARHILTHTGEKPFSCKVCDRKCYTNRSLTRHMLTHTGEKPYSCRFCDYTCSSRSGLKPHMLTHSSVKVFNCELCNYKGRLRIHLVQHMATHTGEKPYACQICDYRCAANGSLTKHMRKHTGEKPYACTVCDYKCSSNKTLVKHKLSHTHE